MAIVLRFVTLDDFVKERLFDLIHVTDICAITLKKELISVISHYNLQVENIRGQGYDGASNMRGEKNGLQALFLKDSPQACYIHYFAHRLQLALVAASREFGKNIYCYQYIVLNNIIEDGTTYEQRGEAYSVSKILFSFEFVFTLHLMKEIMEITNVFCQALQQQSQDILNAMHIVSISKLLLQQLRDDGWCNFLANVKDFYEKHEIEVPNTSAQYVFGRGRSRQSSVPVEHHYRIDVFLATIDS
ncbi:uncharacterized protein LOC130949910 [Arachis stenosperma]|uniref:uncharacterized protein LOC130949910 n=1 Tax=Arachis stenosperma TaxID=217475 RepID=UPI0025AC6497|nr:uncharacterized protein LOC130949910 [Arachis stenosperma]